MKRNNLLFFSLTVISLLEGYFLSAISLVGRLGINLFYTQYKFLKTWWKGALLVWIVWMIFFVLQSYLSNRYKRSTSNLIQGIALLISFVGLYFSYADFRNSLSHRWLGERFHLGVYLFWLVWMAISIFILTGKKPPPVPASENLV